MIRLHRAGIHFVHHAERARMIAEEAISSATAPAPTSPHAGKQQDICSRLARGRAHDMMPTLGNVHMVGEPAFRRSRRRTRSGNRRGSWRLMALEGLRETSCREDKVDSLNAFSRLRGWNRSGHGAGALQEIVPLPRLLNSSMAAALNAPRPSMRPRLHWRPARPRRWLAMGIRGHRRQRVPPRDRRILAAGRRGISCRDCCGHQVDCGSADPALS